jgi:restriction system protein
MLRSHPVKPTSTTTPRELRGLLNEVNEWEQLEKTTTASPKPEPAVFDEWDRLRTSEPEPASAQLQQTATVVRKLPLPEYHWLKKNHRENIQAAKLVLKQLRDYTLSVEPDQALRIVIGTLRRVNSFVFEELLLHCFKEQGFQVIRNSRYTGDDGIDGRLMRDGKLYLVQAKRYSGHIEAAHLREFELTIQRYGAVGGYFIHSGRTGETSWGVARQRDSKIVVLSGMKLVDFVLGESRKFIFL